VERRDGVGPRRCLDRDVGPGSLRPDLAVADFAVAVDEEGRGNGFHPTKRRHHVVIAALRALGEDDAAAKAIKQYEIDGEADAPWRR
jgi:hypothetical protein